MSQDAQSPAWNGNDDGVKLSIGAERNHNNYTNHEHLKITSVSSNNNNKNHNNNNNHHVSNLKVSLSTPSPPPPPLPTSSPPTSPRANIKDSPLRNQDSPLRNPKNHGDTMEGDFMGKKSSIAPSSSPSTNQDSSSSTLKSSGLASPEGGATGGGGSASTSFNTPVSSSTPNVTKISEGHQSVGGSTKRRNSSSNRNERVFHQSPSNGDSGSQADYLADYLAFSSGLRGGSDSVHGRSQRNHRQAESPIGSGGEKISRGHHQKPGGHIPHLSFSPQTPEGKGGGSRENSFGIQDSPPSTSSTSSSSPATSSPFSNPTTRGAFADLGKMKSNGENHTNPMSALLHHHNGLALLDVSVEGGSSSPREAGNKDCQGSAEENLSGHGGSNGNHGNCENPSFNHSHSSSNISSNEENFECIGEGPQSFTIDSHSEHPSLPFSRDVNDLSSLPVPSDASGLPTIRRNSWLRTSLRKSPQHQQGTSPGSEAMGHRRWGSFRHSSGTKRHAVTSSSALANQLYRSSSFHSSGRSSAGDGEEMYSDGSLEDEVIDLTQKVHHLEEKFTVLAENQTDVDDRYVRIKQENAELSTKLFIAEESLRDVEQRAGDKLRDEQKRFKEVLARVEREKQLQIENYDIRLRSNEKDTEQVKGEVTRLKQKLERERSERNSISDKLYETERELNHVREDNRSLVEALRKERDAYLLESKNAQQALLELRKEFEMLRRQGPHSGRAGGGHPQGHAMRFNSVDSESEAAELKSRLNELEEENRQLKHQNKQLQESNEELSAQILNHGLEEGRHLLTVNRHLGDMENSLAAEFEAMSQDQLKKALKEQTEVNDQLRTYIDGILLNIVENYPQLLEVKNGKSTPDNSLES